MATCLRRDVRRYSGGLARFSAADSLTDPAPPGCHAPQLGSTFRAVGLTSYG